MGSDGLMDNPLVERVARAIARALMSRDMRHTPAITQNIYIDTVWKDYIPAAEVAIEECAR